MEPIGDIIRTLREKRDLPLRKVAAVLDIDQAILSKMERGQRPLKKEQVKKLAKFFDVEEADLMVPFLSMQIYQMVGDDEYAAAALRVAEQHVKLNSPKKK